MFKKREIAVNFRLTVLTHQHGQKQRQRKPEREVKLSTFIHVCLHQKEVVLNGFAVALEKEL